MRFSTTLAIIIPFVACSTFVNKVAAERKIDKKLTCLEYDENYAETKGTHWEENGSLRWNFSPKIGDKDYGDILFSESKRIVRDMGRKWNPNDEFWYTLSAGTGKAVGSELWVQCERAKGEGLGQQFKVNFLSKSKDPKTNVLKSYWIMPNQRCKIPSTFAADQVGKITVDSVIPH